jgi:hypothetical protein
MSDESRREEQRKSDFARARRVDALLVASEEKVKRLETELTAARAELAALRAEQAKPLDRPDKPGWWWVWSRTYNEWQKEYVDDPNEWYEGKWLPIAPPRDLREGGE